MRRRHDAAPGVHGLLDHRLHRFEIFARLHVLGIAHEDETLSVRLVRPADREPGGLVHAAHFDHERSVEDDDVRHRSAFALALERGGVALLELRLAEEVDARRPAEGSVVVVLVTVVDGLAIRILADVTQALEVLVDQALALLRETLAETARRHDLIRRRRALVTIALGQRRRVGGLDRLLRANGIRGNHDLSPIAELARSSRARTPPSTRSPRGTMSPKTRASL